MIVIERAWQMGDDLTRIHYVARVDDQPPQMFWQHRDSKLGRLLEQIESVPVS
jgi:hypothetical protein